MGIEQLGTVSSTEPGPRIILFVKNVGSAAVTLDEQTTLTNALTSFSVADTSGNQFPVSTSPDQGSSVAYQNQNIAAGAYVPIADYFVFFTNGKPSSGNYSISASPTVQIVNGPAITARTPSISFTL